MFGWFGFVPISAGLFRDSLSAMVLKDSMVTVAVSATICTLSGTRLLTSPMDENAVRKSSPLHKALRSEEIV